MSWPASMNHPDVVPVPAAFAEQANLTMEPDVPDVEGFWESWARRLDWARPWKQAHVAYGADHRWFVDGQINASANCLDRHLGSKTREVPAIIWEGEDGASSRLTYEELHAEVCKAAGALQALGVERSDRVTMYLPMVPELVVSMLACARIGAVHNVVFGGFSPAALATRMEDSGSKLLITCDGYLRRGKVIPQKQRADEGVALAGDSAPERVLVVERLRTPDLPWHPDRDRRWTEALDVAAPVETPIACDANDPLFVMYTSGTTGKPKGVVHGTGGYLTGVLATTEWILDLKPGDVYWCSADIGWITGHSYIVYGPLMVGASVVMYEGALDWPDPQRLWRIIDEQQVQVFYTAPTAIRALMRCGIRPRDENRLDSLRLLGSVGEPINPEAWRWYHEEVGAGACPIVDTWWQTETGMIMISPLPGIDSLHPGAATRPFPGIELDVVDDDGRSVPAGDSGNLVVLGSWPAMMQGLWQDHDRYVSTYWTRWGTERFDTGDGARIDADGTVWIEGRLDDVLKVSGHRLGTAEIESALVADPDVAEAAVVGMGDAVKGEVPVAFVLLREGAPEDPDIENRLRLAVEEGVGAIARPAAVLVAPQLPKTRSGKIMRRFLRALVNGAQIGDATTLSDPSVVDDLAVLVDTARKSGQLAVPVAKT